MDREAVRKWLRLYERRGGKLVKIIQIFYEKSEVCPSIGGASDWLPVILRVRQGCVIMMV